jgi:hypothetical protein
LTGLVDVESVCLSSTWSNNHSGAEGIVKRLDSFLVHRNLIQDISIFQSWVGKMHSFDHFPVLLELDKPLRKPKSPFKYNSSWAELEEFINLVRDNKTHFPAKSSESASSRFVYALHVLKEKVLAWDRDRRKVVDNEIQSIEYELETLYELLQSEQGSREALDVCRSL